jgi:signal transduction histidine kinase
MSNAIWGEPKSTGDESYPLKLLKGLLQDMLKQTSIYGACLALYDKHSNQMVIRLHMRRGGYGERADELYLDENSSPPRPVLHRNTIKLADQPVALSDIPKEQPLEEERLIIVSTTREDALYSPGSTYSLGQDLIGICWRDSKAYTVNHEQLQQMRANANKPALQEPFAPSWHVAFPLKEMEQVDEDNERKNSQNRSLGVLVLYQLVPADFPASLLILVHQNVERINLYLQNDRLKRLQLRTRDHIKHLQRTSSSFPNTLKLSELVAEVYRFVTSTVDVSSMLLTLYDRDTKKLYDIFTVDRGKLIEGRTDKPIIIDPQDRPHWSQVMQKEKRTLLLSLDKNDQKERQAHEELLSEIWGPQASAETFLLIPMKMFTRVVGSLCITSQRPQAYSPLEILVLETLVQIITVALENAKLYERPRLALQQSKRREESLAATVSALQAISTVLDFEELLRKFVQIAARLAKAEMCSLFLLKADQTELVAQAIFDCTGQWIRRDGATDDNNDDHKELINMIRLPFKDSLLEELVKEGFFSLDSTHVEGILQTSGESGALFLKVLREMHMQKMLVIPLRYQVMDLIGIVVIHTSQQDRNFQPEEIGILMAISAQAASAIRNAQLFEQIQEANAELQRMDKVKDEFIITASHELRTPLSAVSGYSSLLKKESINERINPQKVLKYASKIVDSTRQLKELVENMTQAAKMGALDEKLELHLIPEQLLAATETANTVLNPIIAQHITIDIANDLWVNADSVRLREVMTNLLENASKYSPPYGRILIIAQPMLLSQLPVGRVNYNNLPHARDPEIIKVSVCDEGEGVSPDDAEKIFEKFVRAAHSLTTTVRGTGLGLFICRRFIEAMGGHLWLERSIPGRGSIFSFYLLRVPQFVEMRGQDGTEPEPEEAAGESSHPASESIGR